MGLFYRGYGRRRYRYRQSSSGQGGSYSSEVSRLYGGIDDDVRKLFLALDAARLKLVLDEYESRYGKGKRKYAEKTFREWKLGTVQMGGEISDRLVRLVPPFLTFDQKFELIQKLWERLRQRSNLSVTISPHGGLSEAIDLVMSAVERTDSHELPPAVAQRLDWLAADDAVAAQALLNQLSRREADLAVQTLEIELRHLLAIAAQHPDKIVSATRTVTLPSAVVQICVNQNQVNYRGPNTMATYDNRPNQSNPSDLARRDGAQQPSSIAPIQNPNDLLGEALRRMTPEQQEQVIGKATNEALRLQVKAKEGAIDHEMASSKVDSAAEAAQRLSHTGNEFEVRAEHRSEHGSVQVTVRNKRASLSERVGGCFVATACYGDYEHPAVKTLRVFRDTVLSRFDAGQAFIRWYYRHGPILAKGVEPYAWSRAVGRILLWPLVIIANVLIAGKVDR